MRIVLCCCLFILLAGDGNGQQGGVNMRKTVGERVAIVHKKIESAYAYQLSATTMSYLDSALTYYFRGFDDLHAQKSAYEQRVDQEEFRAAMGELMRERDERFQEVLTAEQYRKWKDEVERSLYPPKTGSPGRQ